MSEVDSLHDVSVLVTRPRGRGESLCRAISARGGSAVRLPLLRIEPLAPDASLRSLIDAIERFDVAIFVSANAVEHAMALMKRRGVSLARHTAVAAVGHASAEALACHGIERVDVPPGRSNSEELLKCDALKRPASRRVVIFRGQGGRELLADTLRSRGADVRYADVYRRVALDGDVQPVVERWLAAPRPVLLLTSAGAARVLFDRLPASVRDALFGASLVVLSDRLAAFCRDCGWRGVIGVSQAASDDALLSTLSEVSHVASEQPS